MTVRDVFNALAMHAPVELKMDFDNVGHLAGRADAAVTRAVVALDITDDVIARLNEEYIKEKNKNNK